MNASMAVPVTAFFLLLGCSRPNATWEHKTVRFDEVTEHDALGRWETTPKFPQSAVDALGKAGWEVVSVDPAAGLVVLKRSVEK